jgi:hypothetical protein
MNENRVYTHTTISDSDFIGLFPLEYSTTNKQYQSVRYSYSRRYRNHIRLFTVVFACSEHDSKDDNNRLN